MDLSEEFPLVWHYTTEAGVYGILENKCIWATHYRFLNDTTEFQVARNVLLDIVWRKIRLDFVSLLPEVFNGNTEHPLVDDIGRSELSALLDSQYWALFDERVLGAEFYVASFCAKHDDPYTADNGLLSQWRGYGVNGGYAIEFEVKPLEDCLKETCSRYGVGSVFGNCIYDDEEEKINAEFFEDINFISEYMLKVLEGVKKNSVEESFHERSDDALNAFINIISRIKHRAFHEESEIRISVCATNIIEDDSERLELPREFRGENKRIPYVELFGNIENLPIKRIIVGPHKNKELRAESLRIWLRNKKINGIDVVVSNTPYIELAA